MDWETGKLSREVRKYLPWLSHVLEDEKEAAELLPPRSKKLLKGYCPVCKGSRLLCGKPSCPVILKAKIYFKKRKMFNALSIEGSSPPDVFVGRMGYPYVTAGPLVPPLKGETSLYSCPELWMDKSIEEIADLRLSLVRGTFKVNVKTVSQLKDRFLEETRELALSSRSVDSEVEFKRKPVANLVFDADSQPTGPSAPVKEMKIGDVKIDRRIEKAYYDDELKAREAVIVLYREKVFISSIQRVLSVGGIGLKRNRRLVPTRWSITAVDAVISNQLREELIQQPFINEYRVYFKSYLNNNYVVLVAPGSWMYELIEAWYPGSTWNPTGVISIGSDWEGCRGKGNYASIGGCYYASRLAVTEHLWREGRQAKVLVLREALPGYIFPVGVWSVRETVRAALKTDPFKTGNLKEALGFIGAKMKTPLSYWVKNSVVLKDLIHQESIEKYLNYPSS